MGLDELVMRSSIWVALALYLVGEITRLRWRAGVPVQARRAQAIWLLGIALYALHVLLAFGTFHGWSHAAAYEFTARQTEALVGWRWGGGIFVNHLFSAAWLAELAYWWLAPERYRQRARWIDMSVRLFFAFMIANGAVIFASGPQRWAGMVIVASLLLGFYRHRR